ncbi:hypothetical protein Tco_0276809 [Tanacetum coccineum]
MYPSTTSESSAGDSSESSARPSRKRCRYLTATVTLSIHDTRALIPSRAHLLPPCKRFRDSISLEDIDRDVEARIDAGIGMEVDVGVDVEDKIEDEFESSERGTIEVGVDVVVGIDIPDAMLMSDAIEHLEQVEEGLQDIYDHVIEIPLQRIEDIEMGQRKLESRSLIAGGERASLLEQVSSLERGNARLQGTMMMERARADRLIVEPVNMTITSSSMTPEAIKELVNRRVKEALAAYEATRAANALKAESQSQNGSDGDNGNGRNGNGGDRNGGNGNGRNGNGGNGNPNETYCSRVYIPRLHEVSTTQLQGNRRSCRVDKAEVVCLRNKIQKMEIELWNLTVKNNDLAAYTQRFQELTIMCTKMVPEEEDRVEKFIGGLTDNI